ncbi:site-specific integrase [Mycetocola reblochoni]|uniref:Site-specific integrase n=1 Tax=Mycetocola reblochoni TaxID=331618 RepID=A0A3L6ZL63_9MICO|nr:site-specific integrase [Mycetocola reblochoni]RLP68395.1 site-specific integrase [Mycetocola reblochoni]
MAKVWIVDLWVKDAKVRLETGETIKVSPPPAQLRHLSKLEDRFKTSRFQTGSRWRLSWYEDTVQGRKLRAQLFRDKRDAEAAAAEMEDDIRSGRYISPQSRRTLFMDAAAEWLASKKQPKHATLHHYKRDLRIYVNPRWGRMPLAQITRRDIDAWVGDLISGVAPREYRSQNDEAVPLGVSSVHRIAGVVFAGVLKHAVASGYIHQSPYKGVELPRPQETGEELVILDHASIAALAESVVAPSGRKTDSVLIYFLAYTGLRINEALALRCDDVDLRRRRVRVLRTWTLGQSGERVVGPPKTWERRSVPLSKFLSQMVEDLVEGRPGDAWVFTAARGGSIHDHNWRNRVWNKAVADVGLERPGLTIHKLRHSAASSAIAAGADVKLVQRMLGHKDATETLNTYGHLWPDRMDAVVEAVDRARLKAIGKSA